MSQKINAGDEAQVSQVPDVHLKICNLGPNLGFFFARNLLKGGK